jgi:hypothetical protein
LLGRFYDGAVACCECRSDLPRSHQQREIPGDDLRDNAERFADE